MKMRVGDRTYSFDPNKFLNVEYMAIERVTGMAIDDWRNALNRNSAIATTALVWILKRRYDGDPTLPFDQVVFKFDDIDVETDEETGKDSTSVPAPPSSEVTNGTESSSSSDSDSDRGNANG